MKVCEVPPPLILFPVVGRAWRWILHRRWWLGLCKKEPSFLLHRYHFGGCWDWVPEGVELALLLATRCQASQNILGALMVPGHPVGAVLILAWWSGSFVGGDNPCLEEPVVRIRDPRRPGSPSFRGPGSPGSTATHCDERPHDDEVAP